MKRSGKAIKYTRSNAPRFARAANVIGAAYKAYKARSKTQTKTESQKPGIQGITTFQKDVKQVYRYKRAPTRLRKRWNRSRRTFTHNLLKQETSRKYHYHGAQTWSSDAGQQYIYGWMSYGVGGAGGADGTGDLADMYTRFNTEQGVDPTLQTGGSNGRRYYYDHMRCRVVLTNTGTNPIFWEIYECVARTDVPITPEGATLQQMLAVAINNTNQATLSGAAASLNTTYNTSASSLPNLRSSGVTPFQFRHFCQNFKIKKVTRLQASPGNTVSFDASDPRNITVNWDNYLDVLAKKGVTKCYLVRQWGAVTAAAPNNSASLAQFEIEKDYNLKCLDTQKPELNYITYTS
uniref:Capsid protein n=1 Tax=Red panda feces-associated genomovirus TaxID=2863991 RepID=A0A8K1M4R6_9VIRU|nr:capsid protein [Red panda feces-associated genomovirus]